MFAPFLFSFSFLSFKLLDWLGMRPFLSRWGLWGGGFFLKLCPPGVLAAENPFYDVGGRSDFL